MRKAHFIVLTALNKQWLKEQIEQDGATIEEFENPDSFFRYAKIFVVLKLSGAATERRHFGWDPDAPGDRLPERRDPCRTCNGTGQIHSHNPNCYDCEGSGIKGFTRSKRGTP